MHKKIVRRTFSAESAASLGDMHPVLRRVYAARKVASADQLEQSLKRLLPYQSLMGIDKAVSLLAAALTHQQRILIVGDFDADGATSSALAVRALKSFGAEQVQFLVPNRFEYGYGLTPELVQAACVLAPQVIVTVDNGIANHAGVEAAKALGICVIITDHHLPAATLPPADAIVNPNQAGDTFPCKNLAGVGVIFYVMLALRRHLVETGWFEQRGLPVPNMSALLDLVALGTVADLVPLDHNNRILVRHGLQRIRAGQCIPAIIALLEVANRDFREAVASDLGFAVAARLNAAGRLDDMSLGIACLLTDDSMRARHLAAQLNQLNQERKSIEQGMQSQALAALKKLELTEEALPRGLCLYDRQWHQGVIGILASRIKDRFHRPVIVFAPGQDEQLKGSGRSIAGFHLRDALALVDARHPRLIDKFGGHAMAAGLTIQRQALETFMKAFEAVVAAELTEEQLQHAWLSDGELTDEDINLELATLLREAGPWGQAFPEPVFDGQFAILEQRIVGDKHLKLRLSKNGKVIEAMAFFVDTESWPNHRVASVQAVYRLDVNEYKGRRSVQLIVDHLEGQLKS
ncbi:MAG: single-stranded-DNA-specific exonuclease RecJ [Gammaproteobacteria bacterium RIFCSPHIGHO2_12_FULL_45_12]|nr:MAG: single-stranded-DNA-specific exonuclease RecJ [Gammaproteobacteria bacterium RIFCSPHIGHO2_12_FULL_45_12]